MREPNGGRRTSDAALLLLYVVGLLVRYARASHGWLLLTRGAVALTPRG